jgi:hypothetical protein
MKNAKQYFDMLWGDFLKNCHGISESSNRGIHIGVYRGDLTLYLVFDFLAKPLARR